MKRVLIIAYHFPPLAGSSGVQRTLRFVQHLPRFGWEAIVLTCHPRAYEETKPDLLRDIPQGTVVRRAFALDSARHLAVGGRYPEWTARPDRWVSWWPGGVWAGREMLRKYQPQALFSTYPIATAHRIGHSLARSSGLPWIADFRDPMAQDGYPEDPRTWVSFKKVEEDVFARATACTFTSMSAARQYRERYPSSSSSISVIENGYDEEAFVEAVADDAPAAPLNPGVLTLVHSGIVYPDERDPSQLFAALSLLKAGGIDGTQLRVRFRAAVHDELLVALATQHGIAEMVEVMPHLPYRDALVEMSRADGLLLLQAASCNAQIPAKLYEYLRARRPLIALTDADGDTAAVMRDSGASTIARLDSATEIADLLAGFVRGDRRGMLATETAIAGASRAARSRQLAGLLDTVTAVSSR